MATIKYYHYADGIYTEDPAGLLVGVQWQDASGNSIRAILFLMDFSTLQNGREISFIYQAEVQPTGTTNWLLRDRHTFKITNTILVIPEANFSRMFHPDHLTEPPPAGIGQLDLFVGLYLKGDQPPPGGTLPPMYHWLAEIIADLEGQVIA